MSDESQLSTVPPDAGAWPEIAKVVEIRECRYGPMLAFAGDTVITRSLQTYGEWSEHEIDGLSHYIRDDTLVLDVGANIGTHSLAFAKRKPRATIWGFEPQPLVNSLAWTNCARNDACNVTILQMACGDEPGEIVLGPPLATEANVGAFSVGRSAATRAKSNTIGERGFGASGSRSTGHLYRAWSRFFGVRSTSQPEYVLPEPVPPFMRVRVTPLDSLRFPLLVSLIKIDVEGMEPAVLSGARRLLARDCPAVFFETLSTENLAAPFALLGGLDYRLFWMETHQFNHANFRKCERNLWWRTEMGVLALPGGVEPHAGLPELQAVPPSLPYRENAREGVFVEDDAGRRR